MLADIRLLPNIPDHQLIAMSRKNASSLMTTVARRLCRRAQAHGLAFHVPPIFSGDHVLLRYADRAIRIDMDGAIIPAGACNDPGWRSNAVRLHALNLRMAARFRRRGDIRSARQSLRLAALDRANCPALPR